MRRAIGLLLLVADGAEQRSWDDLLSACAKMHVDLARSRKESATSMHMLKLLQPIGGVATGFLRIASRKRD